MGVLDLALRGWRDFGGARSLLCSKRPSIAIKVSASAVGHLGLVEH